MIKVFTHAFDFYYKAIPTGSLQLLTEDWYDDSFYDTFENNSEYDRRWFNYVASNGSFPSYPNILTRNVPQLSASISNNGALAFASAANDFLWNVLTPSMSVSQSILGSGKHLSHYRFTYNSESFFHKEYFNSGYGMGVATYPITSSWIAYEPRMIVNASGSTSAGYVTDGGNNGFFPATLTVPFNVAYSLPTAVVPPTANPVVGENPTNITYGNNSTGSNDGRFFDLAGGCGISRSSISASLVLYEANKNGTNGAARHAVATSLKRRRLFFPTIRTGSMALAPNSPGIWVQDMMGVTSDSLFTENGGIYNVTFTIKRDITNGYYPDSGNGSELLIYIHNINTIAPSPTNRVEGATGWYPPEANIVRVKNDPLMNFSNPANGFLLETFNVNVVQYGTPAQLVFEASGSLSSDRYFGCIIDDVQFCKIGVTTDPNLIKPTTTGGVVLALDPISNEIIA